MLGQLQAVSIKTIRMLPGGGMVFMRKPTRHQLRETAYLDGLRGVAAFMVYVYHMSLRHYPAISSWYGRGPDNYQLIRLPFLRDLFCSGQSMVGVFFVISGYVLTNKPLQLCRKQDHAAMYRSISSGMFRRWFRLWVPAYFSTFLAVLAIQADLDIDSPAGPQQHPKLASFSLQVSDWFWEMARFSNPFGYRDHHEQLRMRYDWVTWTLPLEFWAGIALWVVCMAVCQFPRYAVRLTLLLLLAYYALSNGSWHFFCFLSGMMICDLDIESKTFVPKGGIFEILTRRNRQILYWCIFIFGLYIAGAPGIPEYDVWGMDAPGYRWLYARIPHWFHEPYRFYLSWTGITLVFAATRLPALQRCLEADPIQALGRVSFSFFLLHQTSHDVLVTKWLGPALMRWLHTDRSTTWGNNLWFFTMFTLTTPIIYLFASLFQRYVEGNCDRLTRWTEDQFRAGPSRQRL